MIRRMLILYFITIGLVEAGIGFLDDWQEEGDELNHARVMEDLNFHFNLRKRTIPLSFNTNAQNIILKFEKIALAEKEHCWTSSDLSKESIRNCLKIISSNNGQLNQLQKSLKFYDVGLKRVENPKLYDLLYQSLFESIDSQYKDQKQLAPLYGIYSQALRNGYQEEINDRVNSSEYKKILFKIHCLKKMRNLGSGIKTRYTKWLFAQNEAKDIYLIDYLHEKMNGQWRHLNETQKVCHEFNYSDYDFVLNYVNKVNTTYNQNDRKAILSKGCQEAKSPHISCDELTENPSLNYFIHQGLTK